MEYMNLGISGAKRQSWVKDNPRQVLKLIVESNQHGDRESISTEMRAFLKKKENFRYWEAIFEHWFANNYKSLMRESAASLDDGDEQAQIDALSERIVFAVADIILLDWTLPSGKKLRDATGAECAYAGGWLGRVAALVNPDQVVGEVLSEEKVRELYELQ